MANPAYVQRQAQYTGSGTTAAVTLTGVVAGNAIVAACMRYGSTDRTLTVTDDKSGSYADAVAETVAGAGNCEIQISYAVNVAGGDTIVTLTLSGTGELYLVAYEVSGLNNAAPVNATSTNDEGSSTTHTCAASGAIDTVANVFVVSVSSSQGSLGTVTPNANYTANAIAQFVAQYRVSAGALTDETAAWTSDISRAVMSGIASFKGAPAGNPWHAYAQQ